MVKVLTFVLCLHVLAAISYAQWTQIQSSPSYIVQDVVESNGVLYLAHVSDGVYRSTDSTVTWLQINNGLNTSEAKSVYQLLVSEGTLWAATVDGIYKSTNNGDSWTKKSNGITIGPGALYEYCASIFEHDGVLYSGAWNGIYRSTDRGDNWVITNVSGEAINAKSFIHHDGKLFAARENSNNPGAYASSDGGITWQGLTIPFFSAITFLSEPGRLWAGTIDGVWLSTNDGTSWQRRYSGLSPDPYSSSIIRIDGTLVTSLKFGGSGMFRSSDEGLHWGAWGEGLPFLNSIEKLMVFDDRIIAATSDGLWQRAASEVVTNVKGQNNTAIGDFKLFQNYPNPFNPSTTIRYHLPTQSPVTLKIYDMLGNEIATLMNAVEKAGYKSVNWETSSFASGMYFYRLQTGDFVQTKKLILMK